VSTTDFPYGALSRELLDALQDTFPLRAPRPNDSHQALMWHGGERAVIEFLEQQFKRNTDPEPDEDDPSEN
jgi:hypothetical protein